MNGSITPMGAGDTYYRIALTTNRPYRSGRTHDEAVAELHRCAGTQFDPQAVHAFCAAFEQVSDYFTSSAASA